ncbi:unnamed protein product [Brachionus calyciflorus]|uniref:Apple domain-containing protein n=1 Tax=Brachionus calyciflorus TaxID=104777 RepID=A0A813X6W4_9BILA|nr:unnamed protein product [Brachionus calyciflorus]
MKTFLKLIFLIFTCVLAEPPKGYHLLPDIHLNTNFSECIDKATEKIFTLQGLRDTNQIIYVLPVYLYDANKPIYLGLNVRSTNDGNGDVYKEYLYLREIYLEFRTQENFRPSSFINYNLNVDYSTDLPEFNLRSLTFEGIIKKLKTEPRETVIRLALVFVESLRFWPVKQAVQNSLNSYNTQIINFRTFNNMIRSWETESARVVESFGKGIYDILYNISVYHIRHLARCFTDLPRINCKKNNNKKYKRNINNPFNPTCMSNPNPSYPNVLINMRLYEQDDAYNGIKTEYECWLKCFYNNICVASMYSNQQRICYIYSKKLKYHVFEGYAVYMKQNYQIEDFSEYKSYSCCGYFDFRCCCTKADGTVLVNNIRSCTRSAGCVYGWKC